MSVSVTQANPDSSTPDLQQNGEEDGASLKSLFYRAFKIYNCRFRDSGPDLSLIHSTLTVEGDWK